MLEVKGKLNLLGGRGIHPVKIYDPLTNRWSQKSPPLFEIHHFQPITYNGYITLRGITGPYPNDRVIPNMIISYPDTDQWIVGDSLPHSRLRGQGEQLYTMKNFTGLVD